MNQFATVGVLSGSIVIYSIWLVLWRLVWNPLARIPGPKLAAATFWYEFYYDVVKGGQYTWKIRDLHKQYGPIIRINPYEVHIDDPDYYDKIYVAGATRKTNKWLWSANAFAVPLSMLTSIPHDLHRQRRAMVAPKFSPSAVLKLEPLVKEKVDKLLRRLSQAASDKKPLCLTHAYAALSIDVVTAYTFLESWNYLDAPDFAPAFLKIIEKGGMLLHLNKQFPFLLPVLKSLPTWLSVRFSKDQQVVIDREKDFIRQVSEVHKKRQQSKGTEMYKAGNRNEGYAFRSVFEAMLDADVPESDKSLSRLVDEGQVLVIAGGSTTARALEIITYHVLSDQPILKRLQDELLSASAKVDVNSSEASTLVQRLSTQQLEKLPYLTGVIREGLRLSYGVSHRLQRVSPDQHLDYHGYVIPSGTPVSMSALHIHENESIFPEALAFQPERWLPLDSRGHKLSKYLVAFSRGSRQCLGMNLAMAELYLGVAALFGSGLRMRLHETNFERDIKTTRDGFNPFSSAESKDLRVIVESAASYDCTS